jgi:hypothetical protein
MIEDYYWAFTITKLLTLKFPSSCSHQRVLWILPCNFSLVLFVSHFSFWCCVDPAENLSTICFFSSFEFYCSPWVHDCLVRYVIHIHSNFFLSFTLLLLILHFTSFYVELYETGIYNRKNLFLWHNFNCLNHIHIQHKC